MRAGLNVSLSDRTAVVTDACSPLGSTVAATLARRGATVTLLDKEPRRVRSLASTINQLGGGIASAHSVDLTDTLSVFRVANAIGDAVNPVDLLVLTTAEALRAHAPPAPPENLPKRWRRTLDDGVCSVRNAIEAFADQLIAAGQHGPADIVAIAAGAPVPKPRVPGTTLCERVREEFSVRGVRITAIERSMARREQDNATMSDISGMLRMLDLESLENEVDDLSVNDIADLIGYVVGQPEHVALPCVTIMSPKPM